MNALKPAKRARKGNLLTIVLIVAIVAILLCGVVKKAANDLYIAKEEAGEAVEIYSGLAMADIFADAFIFDLGSQYVQEPIPVGMTEVSRSFYEELISGTQGIIDSMNLKQLASGSYQYTGDARAVADDVQFTEESYGVGVTRKEYQVSRMEQRFENLAKKIDDFIITLPTAFVPDESAAGNILNGESGDRYYIRDMEFALDFNIGIQDYHRDYLLTGLYAEFSQQDGKVTCNIRTDEAQLTLVSQRISN